MTPDILRECIAALRMSQAGTARFLGYNRRTVNRWAMGDEPIPDTIAMLLTLMVDRQIEPNTVRRLIGLPKLEGLWRKAGKASRLWKPA